MIPSFLCHLTFADTEFRINKQYSNLKAMESRLALTAGNLLNSSNLLITNYPNTACQLNWHNANLEDIIVDWLVSASIFLNPRVRSAK